MQQVYVTTPTPPKVKVPAMLGRKVKVGGAHKYNLGSVPDWRKLFRNHYISMRSWKNLPEIRVSKSGLWFRRQNYKRCLVIGSVFL
ncbi:hypothetical protein Y032_0526g2953 [Ancylostoma ceylanicum]|uniref:Uncharacterized protein n=1 Tax=Ancylostoma ceylanicum TaxID=53326 RepID=A0A016WUA9_9BILA|nr:hypothetical protein Y032_0526g2953 [Ancylostoma ceylanicum]